MPSEDAFPITAAQLVGIFCETLFYGVYLVTCCFCVPILLLTGHGRHERWLRLSEIRWLMAFVFVAMFVVLTFDVGIGLLHNYHAFVQAKDATVELLKFGDWINVARFVDQGLAMLLGDFILIYRCWIVHGRRWLIIMPSVVLLFGTIAIWIRVITIEADPSTQKNITLSAAVVRPWNVSLFATTAAQNVITTSILIWRIWRVERQVEKYLDQSESTTYRPRRLRRVIRVIAESGAAYTLMAFITFVVCAVGGDGAYPAADITLVITGIVFNAILVRSSPRRDKQFQAFDNNERMVMTDCGRQAASTLRFADLATTRPSLGNSSPSDDLKQQTEKLESSSSSFQPDSHTCPSGVPVVKSVVTV